MGWPIAFSCFALLQLPGLSQLLSSFSDPSCQAGSCASALCLPAHREPDFDLRRVAYPPPSLSSHRRADFACTSIKRLDFNWNNCFLPRILSIQGTRCARAEEGTFPDVLGLCYASKIKLPPDIRGLSSPPTPANGPAQYCGHFHLEIFPPRCVTSALPVDSPLLSSLISLGHAGLQRAASQVNKFHFTLVHLQKLSSEVSTPSPTLGKNDWKMVEIQ